MSCFELNEHVLRIREIPCPSCGLPRMHIFGFCGNFLLSLRYRFINGIDFVFESVYLFDDVHLQKIVVISRRGAFCFLIDGIILKNFAFVGAVKETRKFNRFN